MRPLIGAEGYDPAWFEQLEPKLELLAGDLAWWAKALAAARNTAPTPR